MAAADTVSAAASGSGHSAAAVGASARGGRRSEAGKPDARPRPHVAKDKSPSRTQGARSPPRQQRPKPVVTDLRSDPELRKLILMRMEKVMKKRGLSEDISTLRKVRTAAIMTWF